MGDVVRAGWRMTGPGRLTWFEEPLRPAPPGHVTVEVVGCGICHTDLGYLFDGVAPVHKGPIVLGHEIIGRVAGRGLVLVPAVSPCGDCAACRRGRATSCSAALMPGNHHDGGFATHVQVPARWLTPVPDVADAWQLAAIADAVTTPLQAVRRTQLASGDVAIVLGVGGVGGFLVEIAVALGATVVAIDVAAARLTRALEHGAALAIDGRELAAKGARKEVAKRLAATKRDVPDAGWHVFECSGTTTGQTVAFGLLTRGGKLAVVGFTPEVVSLRLSNLMALDAEAYGNWGAEPALYGEALGMVLAGKVDVASAVARYPLRDAPDVLDRSWCRMPDHAISISARDDGAFLELRLGRPPRNVLDGDALATLAALAATAASDRFRAARAILLTADGPNFSVGASVPEHARAQAVPMLGRFHRAIRALLDGDLPIVAAVRGHCLGGGLELVSLATRVVAHPAATLGQPEIRLGALAPVASLLLPHRIGQARAEDLLLTGRTVDAPAALGLGLVDAVADDPERAAADWIRANLVPHSASSLRLATRAARTALRRELSELLPVLERLYADELSPTHDAEEGVGAFLEKRTPRWEHR